jgi:hypothetical protein
METIHNFFIIFSGNLIGDPIKKLHNVLKGALETFNQLTESFDKTTGAEMVGRYPCICMSVVKHVVHGYTANILLLSPTPLK